MSFRMSFGISFNSIRPSAQYRARHKNQEVHTFMKSSAPTARRESSWRAGFTNPHLESRVSLPCGPFLPDRAVPLLQRPLQNQQEPCRGSCRTTPLFCSGPSGQSCRREGRKERPRGRTGRGTPEEWERERDIVVFIMLMPRPTTADRGPK